MNQAEMIDDVAEITGLSKAAAKDAIKAVVSAINNGLTKDGRVSVPELGTFSIGHRAEREGRNLQTKETMTIPAKNVPKFKAAPAHKLAAETGEVPTAA
jgi:DNA-binding protein HU-beta